MPRKWPWIGVSLVALPALVAYLATLQPSVYYVDSGIFLATIKDFGVGYAPGFPLYIMAAKLWTLVTGFLPFAQSVHTFSAFSAAATAVVVYLSAFQLLAESDPVRAHSEAVPGPPVAAAERRNRAGRRGVRRRQVHAERRGAAGSVVQWTPADPARRRLAFVAAVAAGWLTAFAYTIWSQAINAASFTFHGLFAALMLYATIRLWQTGRLTAAPTVSQRRLILILIAAWGCAWSVHYLSIGFAPFMLLMIYRHRVLLGNRVLVRQGIGVFLITGVLPYLQPPIRSAAWPLVDWGHVADPMNWILHLTGANWTTDSTNFRFFAPGQLFQQTAHWAELTLYQFVPIALIAVIAGWYFLRRWYRPLFAPLLLFYLGCVGVGLIYVTNNGESYIISAHMTLALLAAVGLFHGVTTLEHAMHRRTVSWYSAGTSLGLLVAVGLTLALSTLYINYPSMDRRNSFAMEDYGKNAFVPVAQDGIMLVPGDILNASVLFLQVGMDHRSDIEIVPESLVHFDWWRDSFRHHNPTFYLPEIPLESVSDDEEWMTELLGGLLENNPDRELHLLTLKGKQIPDGYTVVPAGIGYRVVAETDKSGLDIKRSDWDFSFQDTDELLNPVHSLQRAYNIFRREIQLAYVQAYQNLAELDFNRQQYDLAAEGYATALEFVPSRPDLSLGLGASLAMAGRSPEALQYLGEEQRRLLTADGEPEDHRIQVAFGFAWNEFGGQWYASGNIERALQAFLMAHTMNPTDPDTLANLGGVLAAKGDHIAALSYLQQGVQRAPDNAKLYFNLAQVYDSLNDRAHSEEMFERAFALDPALRRLLNQ